jgi:hypothetical protein
VTPEDPARSVQWDVADRATHPGDGPGPMSPLAEAVEGFIGLARWVTREVGEHTRAVAGHIDGDFVGEAYPPDLAARDIARAVALVPATWLRVANEVVDSAVVLAMAPGPNTYDIPLRLPKPFDGPCWLRLHPERGLVSHFHPPDVIPRTKVALPREVRAGEVAFTIHVDATRRPGVTYWGRVIAVSQADPSDVQHVDFCVGVS